MSTAISKSKAYLAPLYINSDQQSKPPQAQPRPRLTAKIQLAQAYINNERQSESTSGRQIRIDQSGVSTAISKAQAYLHEQCLNRDSKAQACLHSRISTAISRAKAHLAQQGQ